MHAQAGVDHGGGVAGWAHLRGAHGVEDGGADVACGLHQFFIVLQMGTGFQFGRLVRCQSGLSNDAPRHPQRLRGDGSVVLGGQIVRRDTGRILQARRTNVHLAPAGGVQVANAGGEGVEAVQRFAKGVERQRLHVVLQIGVGLIRTAAGESTQLARRHAHGATAAQQVVQPNHSLAPPRLRHHIEGAHAPHLKAASDLQMVLQIAPHAREWVAGHHAMGVQQLGIADA